MHPTTTIIFRIQNRKQMETHSLPCSKIDIFSAEFLGSLRAQLSSKCKLSKSVLQALKYANSMNIQYKKQIEQLKRVISMITNERDTALKQKELILKQKQQISNLLSQALSQRIPQPNPIQSNQKNNKLSLSSLDGVKISSLKQDSGDLEILLMKQELDHLHQYKRMKEARAQEMVQRQAEFMGEISLLKSNIQLLNKELNRYKSNAIQQQLNQQPSPKAQLQLQNYISQQTIKKLNISQQDGQANNEDEFFSIRSINSRKDINKIAQHQNTTTSNDQQSPRRSSGHHHSSKKTPPHIKVFAIQSQLQQQNVVNRDEPDIYPILIAPSSADQYTK